jgi:hypothetical protein
MMVLGPKGAETKNYFADESQQQTVALYCNVRQIPYYWALFV